MANTLDQAYKEVLEELLQMFLKKHKDYGKGNILANKELGIAMRVSEKVERLKHLLMQGSPPTNESIDETWTDIAVYAVIARLLRNGSFEKLDVGKESHQ
jgi:hypothetical protein